MDHKSQPWLKTGDGRNGTGSFSVVERCKAGDVICRCRYGPASFIQAVPHLLDDRRAAKNLGGLRNSIYDLRAGRRLLTRRLHRPSVLAAGLRLLYGSFDSVASHVPTQSHPALEIKGQNASKYFCPLFRRSCNTTLVNHSTCLCPINQDCNCARDS